MKDDMTTNQRWNFMITVAVIFSTLLAVFILTFDSMKQLLTSYFM